MLVVTANLHAGVDGWGRPTDALATVLEVNADIVICPETWRGEGDDFVTTLNAAGYDCTFAGSTFAERVVSTTPPVATRRWQPWSAHLTGERGLYYGTHRSLSWWQKRTRRHQTFEQGRWGLTLASRLPVLNRTIVDLGRLPRERVNRFAVMVTVQGARGPVDIIAVHGAHLSHGSPLWFWRLHRALITFRSAPHALVAGDFNAWTPVVRLLLPGWAIRGKGRTWPSPHPHSQIDHIVTQGSWAVDATGTKESGSDHLALYCAMTPEY